MLLNCAEYFSSVKIEFNWPEISTMNNTFAFQNVLLWFNPCHLFYDSLGTSKSDLTIE